MTTNLATALLPPAQKRILKTAIPGPESLRRQGRRNMQVASPLGATLPIFVEQAFGGIIVDADGNHIIDLASGIAVTSVGASNPRVVEAVRAQVERFTHTCFLVTEYDGFVDVAAALNRLTPGGHDKRTALFTTGAEAVENAVKIARSYTGRPAVVVFDHAYHGRTLLTMTMTAKNRPYRAGFGPFAPEIYRLPMPYAFRWPGNPEKAASEALAQVRDALATRIGAENVAAMVIEPIQGEGGFIVPAPGFLPGLTEICSGNGIVFVVDEIQTGLARTGSMFASEHEGLIPDLVLTAKALGGGLPLSAVTGRTEIMNSVPLGGLGGTYAGNPVACAAALAVLECIESEDLAARARAIEAKVMPVLQELLGADSIVGDVRGRGAMIAVEFVGADGREPNARAATAVARYCHQRGVLVLVCGTFGNVIRLLPPLVIEDALLLDGIAVLVDGVNTMAARG